MRNRWPDFLCVFAFLSFPVFGAPSWGPLPEIPSRAEYYVVSGQVINPTTCTVVPGAEVFWVSVRGTLLTIQCDESGRFNAPMDKEFGWGSVIYARHGNSISQWESPRSETSLFREFELGPPAQLSGVAKAKDGTPVVGASIRVKTNKYYPYYLWEAITDDEGRYTIAGLPPGDVLIDFVHERYRAPDLSVYEEAARVRLVSGKMARCDLTVEALTPYSGRTVGPDGAPAGHVELTLQPKGHRGIPSEIRSDGDGFFSCYARPGQQIVARHPQWGIQAIRVPMASSLMQAEEIEIRLPGTTRVTGQLRGAMDEPIAGALVRINSKQEITDGMGRFDFAYLPLPGGDHDFQLHVWPMNPKEWRNMVPSSGAVPDKFLEQSFYASTARTFSGLRDDVIELDIELEPLIARRVGGVVWDEAGEPMAGATVLVYDDFPRAEQWLQDLLPDLPLNWPPMPVSRSRFIPPPAELLIRVQSDDEGRWETGVVMGQNYLAWGEGGRSNFSKLTVVAGVPGGRQSAMIRQVVADNTNEVNVDLKLAPTPEELWMDVAVVDTMGQPVAGSRWGLAERSSLESDESGRLRIPRVSDYIQLNLRDENRHIVAVKTSGAITFPARPAIDPPEEEDGVEKPSLRRATRRVIGTEAANDPRLTWKDTYLTFLFFDTREGPLEITLGALGE